MDSDYKPRIVDEQLREELETVGAIEIRGPKWVGKTTTAEQQCMSSIYMNDPDMSEQNLQLAAIEPSRILAGENPRLIDEWQMAPRIWDAVKYIVDHSDSTGMFVLTGSSRPDLDAISDIGAGRFSTIVMRTMSLYESGNSTGDVSLSGLFSGRKSVGTSNLKLEDVARILVRGGWPKTVDKSDTAAHRLVRAYCNALMRTGVRRQAFDPDADVPPVDEKIERDAHRMGMVLKSLSRNESSQAPYSTILEDVNSNEKLMDRNRLSDYIRVLREMYVIEDMPSWTPKLRSKTAIRTTETRHLTDPAIAAFFLGASAEDLMNDLNTFGLLFESLVVRDLRVYAQTLEGDVYHYRDKDGLEADAVVHLFGGRWGAIEVKLGGQAAIDAGASNLRTLADKIDGRRPDFLAVVTAVGNAYTRPDGVHVIPIGCLGP